MAARTYLALIGDMPGSRRSSGPERTSLQEHLLGWTEELSRSAPQDALAAALILTGGDGVQALLHAPQAAHSVALIQELTDRLLGFLSAYLDAPFPPIVFGVGFGTLSTGEVPLGAPPVQNPGTLDGPCFHSAREALERARKERVWVRFRGLGEPQNKALDALFDLMGAIRAGWTSNQGLMTYEVRRTSTQKVLADERKVSPSVISETLKAARFRELVAGEEAARALIEARVKASGENTEGDPE